MTNDELRYKVSETENAIANGLIPADAVEQLAYFGNNILSLLDQVEAAKRLLDKMDKIYLSEEYRAVWELAVAHGIPYLGETWENEADALRAELLGK